MSGKKRNGSSKKEFQQARKKKNSIANTKEAVLTPLSFMHRSPVLSV
jgi:hypothetical protein